MSRLKEVGVSVVICLQQDTDLVCQLHSCLTLPSCRSPAAHIQHTADTARPTLPHPFSPREVVLRGLPCDGVWTVLKSAVV